ncbi:glucose-1-phosphate thymidylyltransferase [Streptomyces sp. RerS4]|uniref:glucose-1-phosphate thymidylyltransferase n=1 Tax=Streptomyces sp. RerS4 TaxID=2942449 RepID=UPI00201BE1EB|nr:glucose-1-phosphate thymidylyltransferase [Streptomyces sp. RerS4]UQX05377.1 glucose-1-phosphate thymidylyltransferase [Streptomyces sp. RerS4]
MKALVLAGGSGTRLRPLSHSMPKQLMPIANKPVLEYVLENIRAAGVEEIGVIVGQWAEEFTRVLGDGSRFGARLTYIRQDRPLGLAHCVRLARPFLGDDDFVLYLGDIVLPDGITEAAARFVYERPAAHVMVRKVPDPRAFGVVELDEVGRVRALVEKPRQPRSDLALMGVYFFTPAVHEAVAAIGPGARGELEITDALQWMVSAGAPVTAGEHDGYWQDTGSADAVLACNRRLLGALEPALDGWVDGLSVLDGPVVLGPGARVVGSRITGPAVIGAGTLVEDSRIGPFTSVGRDCVLRGAYVSDSIVLDGATVADVPRLHDSIIGRSATVGPAGAHHRLVVGDHTRVEIAA